MTRAILLILCFMLVGFTARAADVSVAVASNFLPIAEQIASDFERQTGSEVSISHGSTGQLYALIANGAPIDVFLAADRDRPFRLLEEGTASQIRTYAVGRLFLVSRAKINVKNVKEFFEGKNVADYYDPEIMDKLAKLEEEEKILEEIEEREK